MGRNVKKEDSCIPVLFEKLSLVVQMKTKVDDNGLDLLAEAPGSAELLERLNERDSAKQVAADRDAAMAKFLKYARGGK